MALDLSFDPSLFLRSPVRFGGSPSQSGRMECQDMHALLVVSFASPGFSLLLQSSSRLDSAAAVFSFSHLEVLLPPQGLARLDSLSALMSLRASNTIPILDKSLTDPSIFARSFLHLSFLLPVLSLIGIGFILLAQNPS